MGNEIYLSIKNLLPWNDILFLSIVLFLMLCMDWQLWRRTNRPAFVGKINKFLITRFGHIQKIGFVKFPKAFKDFWHFSKMFLVGYLIYSRTGLTMNFIYYSIGWIVVWFILFDWWEY